VPERADPWDSPDPALMVAVQELRWYQRGMRQARIAHKVSEVLLLLTSAATTVIAALAAPPWLTAVFAASSLVIAGVRKSFDWHESWVSFATNWSELRSAVHQYRLLPEEGRDEQARRALVAKADEIAGTETSRWASRRRALHKAVNVGH
jgi:uncharacterized protein DUF4231